MNWIKNWIKNWKKISVALLISIVLVILWETFNPFGSQDVATPEPSMNVLSESTSTPAPTTTPEPTPAPTPTPIVKPYVAPLTGMPNDQATFTRPIVVMVENHQLARPQSGLHQADLVYEVLAEGEITRFISVFQSQAPEKIGPVRSIRPYFIDLGNALNGILVHAGWSQEAMDMMTSKNINHLDELYGDGGAYWRSTDRKPPHNLYTSIELINKRVAERRFPTSWQAVSYLYDSEMQTIPNGTTAVRMQIPYIAGYQVSYQFDKEKKAYARSMNNAPHIDRESGTRIVAQNVIVIETSHRIIDDIGRRAVNVIGPGEGAIFQNGMMQNITWELKNGLIRAYVNNREVKMVPGVTWVQIVPTGTLAKMKVE